MHHTYSLLLIEFPKRIEEFCAHVCSTPEKWEKMENFLFIFLKPVKGTRKTHKSFSPQDPEMSAT